MRQSERLTAERESKMKPNKTQKLCIGRWIRRAAVNPYYQPDIHDGAFEIRSNYRVSFEAFSGRGRQGGRTSGGWRVYNQAMKLEQLGMFEDGQGDYSTSSWSGWGASTSCRRYRATDALIDFIKTQWIWKSDNSSVGYEFGPELPSCARLADRAVHGSTIKFI